jgi:hypothetical protein
MVVYDRRQLIARQSLLREHNKVAYLALHLLRLEARKLVLEKRFHVGATDAKTRGTRRQFWRRCGASFPASAWISKFMIAGMRRARFGNLGSRARTWIHLFLPPKFRQCLAVRLEISRLKNRTRVPVHPQPFQVLDRLASRLRLDARAIQIIDAEQDVPALLAGEGPIDKKRPRISEVQSSRW